jgi:hypothetical protein
MVSRHYISEGSTMASERRTIPVWNLSMTVLVFGDQPANDNATELGELIDEFEGPEVLGYDSFEDGVDQDERGGFRFRGLLPALTLLLLAVFGAGCDDLVAFRCADPNAEAVVTRDDAGNLQYEGCVDQDVDADEDEVEK